MDIHNRIIGAVFAKGFFYKGIKGIPLSSCGKRSVAAKELIYKGTAQLLGIFGVVENSVYVCTSVDVYKRQQEGSMKPPGTTWALM